jgi:tetratricopeptide (TPR) repeat protein
MFKKFVIALFLLGILFPVGAEEEPSDFTPFRLITLTIEPNKNKLDVIKGSLFKLVFIEKNSNFKLTQKENYEDYYYKIAQSYIDKKEYKIAIKFLDKAIILYPKNSHFYGLRGISYANLNQHKRAIEDYTKAIYLSSLDPYTYSPSPYTYALRASSYASLHQYERAIEDETKAINLNPQDKDFYISRGLSYSELKQYEKAILDFSKCISLNPKDAECYYRRSYNYIHLNEYDKAKLDLINASEIYKELGDITSYNNVQELLNIIRLWQE